MTLNEKYIREVYENTNEQLYKYLIRLVGEENADDILQETWEKFIKNAELGKLNKGTEKSWLYKVAHNASMDFYRKRKKIVQDDNFLDNLPAENWDANKSYEKIKRKDFQNIIEKLALEYDASGKSLALLALLRENNLTQREIGKIMNKSERTIRRMIERLFKFLEKKLIEYEINIDFLKE
ncbi:MAG: sigma-70 family RNA polymerase sigma factor [Spirochaetia bacterium]|nr:sigma-70 family RNA polymerase sigma factor [Spirochaetia bacterium]